MYQGHTMDLAESVKELVHSSPVLSLKFDMFIFLRVDIFLILSKRRNSLILGRELHLFTLAREKLKTHRFRCQKQVGLPSLPGT